MYSYRFCPLAKRVRVYNAIALKRTQRHTLIEKLSPREKGRRIFTHIIHERQKREEQILVEKNIKKIKNVKSCDSFHFQF